MGSTQYKLRLAQAMLAAAAKERPPERTELPSLADERERKGALT